MHVYLIVVIYSIQLNFLIVYTASRSNQASKEFCLYLRLSQSDIQALQTSDTSVHLRFCPYNTHSIQEDSYPKQLYIKINERMVSIPVSCIDAFSNIV